MKPILLFSFLAIFWTSQSQIYRDSSKEIALRVEDLLHRMTWEEKCHQLFMVPGDTNLLHGQLQSGILEKRMSTDKRMKVFYMDENHIAKIKSDLKM